MSTTDTGHLIGKNHAQTICEHLHDVGEKTKQAAMTYLTTGKRTPYLDETTKMLIDEGLQGGLEYLIKCAKELQRGIAEIEANGFELQ